MRNRSLAARGAGLGVFLTSLGVSPALALAGQAEVAIGYNHLGPQQYYEHSYAAGAFLGVGIQPIKRLALVCEAAANSGSTLDSSFDLRFRSLQAGPRVSLLSNRSRVKIHAQFLIGIGRYGWRSVSPVLLDWAYQDHLILQPGVGVDVAISNHFAARAGVGMSFFAFKSTPCGSGCEPYTDWATQLRAHVGIVVHTAAAK